MDNSLNGKLEKYFFIIAVSVFFFTAVVLLYRQFIYLPQQKADYIRSITPGVAEERIIFTPEEDAEMKAAYEEIMLKKYGKTVNVTEISPNPSAAPAVKKK
jgi:hypothetical protein